MEPPTPLRAVDFPQTLRGQRPKASVRQGGARRKSATPQRTPARAAAGWERPPAVERQDLPPYEAWQCSALQ
ncbi:unnamed protein product, partial [Prorocentrum cordatum]